MLNSDEFNKGIESDNLGRRVQYHWILQLQVATDSTVKPIDTVRSTHETEKSLLNKREIFNFRIRKNGGEN